MIFSTTQIETNRKLMQRNLHLSYPNAIGKPNISLQEICFTQLCSFLRLTPKTFLQNVQRDVKCTTAKN